jgi:alkylhydroperoxidase family enzyme
LARRHGYTEDQVEHLADFRTRSDFSDKEKVALEFAERMTTNPQGIDEELWSRLRAHFDEGEVIELSAAIGLFNYFNRFNDALKMEPTK